jgi:hypothetical protein
LNLSKYFKLLRDFGERQSPVTPQGIFLLNHFGTNYAFKGKLSSEKKKIKQNLGPIELGNLSFHAKFQLKQTNGVRILVI